MKNLQGQLKSFKQYFKYAATFFYSENGLTVKIFFVLIMLLKAPACFSYIKVMQPAAEAMARLMLQGVADVEVLMEEASGFINMPAFYGVQLDFFISEMWIFIALGLYSALNLAMVRRINIDESKVALVVRIALGRLVLFGILWTLMYFAGLMLFFIPAALIFYTAIFCFCHLADSGAPPNAHIIAAFSVSRGIRIKLIGYTLFMWAAIMVPTFILAFIASAYSPFFGGAVYVFGDTIRTLCTCRMMVDVYNDITPYKDNVKLQEKQDIEE